MPLGAAHRLPRRRFIHIHRQRWRVGTDRYCARLGFFRDGLLWFPFNQTAGLTTPESGGGLSASLEGFDNDPAQWVAGRFNRALEFDGVDDYVSVTGFNGITGAAPRTLAAWVKTTNSGVNQPIIAWGPNTTGNKWTFLMNSAGQIRLEISGGYVVGTRAINNGAWHHVACTFTNDGTPNVTDVKLFVNGTPETLSTSQGTTINTFGTFPVKIGSDVQSRFWQGALDEVRIYDRALSAAELAALATTTNQSAAAWHRRYFGNGAEVWAGDADADGVNALGEYAFGGEPHLSGRAMLPAPLVAEDQLEVEYLRRLAGTHELLYELAVSSNLQAWTPLGIFELWTEPAPELTGFERARARKHPCLLWDPSSYACVRDGREVSRGHFSPITSNMKFCCIKFFLCRLALTLGVSVSIEAAAPPNILVIVTDDQGAADAGCYGAKDLATPNIDALAARGIRFTQFYSAAPVCSPSRAALLTGRYPLRARLTGNAASQPGAPGAMPSAQVTMAEMFKAAGYATGHFGKWHLGYTPDTMPNAQGFDHSFGHMGGCIDNFSHFFYWAGPNRHDLHRNGVEVQMPGRYFPDLMVEEAARFIERHRAGPFFIYFALNMPHYPYQGETKWLERFKDLPYPRNLYAAFLASCDERIGALLKKVDDAGLREQTIVVFQSDNGHSTEERAHFGGGSAGIYRGQKFSLFEGGIHLPAIVSWPGQLPAGETRGQLAHACDWLPTLAELTGVKILNPDLDGKSLAPVLRSAAAVSPHEVLQWQVGGGIRPQWAVRKGDWKLIGNVQSTPDPALTAEDKREFLSNLAADPGEKTNWVQQNPEMAAHLRKLRSEWIKANKASQPDGDGATKDKQGNEK